MKVFCLLCTIFLVGGSASLAAAQKGFVDYECPCKNRNKKPAQPQPETTPDKTIKTKEKSI